MKWRIILSGLLLFLFCSGCYSDQIKDNIVCRNGLHFQIGGFPFIQLDSGNNLWINKYDKVVLTFNDDGTIVVMFENLNQYIEYEEGKIKTEQRGIEITRGSVKGVNNKPILVSQKKGNGKEIKIIIEK